MMCCKDGKCYCKGIALIVLGLILVANEYWGWTDPWYLLGALLVIGGIVKLFMPCCCKAGEKKEVAKKRRR